jgi:L-asparaginase
MADIFISYAKKDNRGIGPSEEEPIKQIVMDLQTVYAQQTGRKELMVFFDEDSLEPGVKWEQTIAKELESSLLMISFLSPSFFNSEWCGKEWDYFANERQPHTDEGLINRIRKAKKIQYDDYTKVRSHPDRHEPFLEKLAGLIDKKLEILGSHRDRPNIHTIEKCIDQKIIIDENTQRVDTRKMNEVYKSIEKDPNRYEKTPPVCVIYTGGTVGMVRSDPFDKKSILANGTIDDLKQNIDRLDMFEFDIHFYSYEKPLDSSNIDSEDWIKLANIISCLYSYYQGFVILHGTDTMVYTASALSFMFKNLGKPVILTGAERPPTQLGSDAKHNVMRAIQAAAPQTVHGIGNLPEVCILFGKQLMRGNRAKKKKSLDMNEGFYSPNYPPLGIIEDDIVLNHANILRPVEFKSIDDLTAEELMLDDKVNKDDVMIFEVYPDMNLKRFHKVFMDPSLKGVILKTYGTGNAPTTPIDLLKYIKKMIENKVIIINLTQCPEGKVEVRLFETNSHLFDLGVINGGDMTAEAAYCKLKYLLGQYKSDPNRLKLIKQKMQIDLRGELKLSAYSISYSDRHLDLKDRTIAPKFSGPALAIGDFDPRDIDHAYLRIQGVEPLKNQPIPEQMSLKIYVNRQDVQIDESQGDINSRIGWFKRPMKTKEGKVDDITQNLEVTREILRLINPKRESHYTLQVVSDNNAGFTFKTLELTVFTHRR